jgi:hypothetical protein
MTKAELYEEIKMADVQAATSEYIIQGFSACSAATTTELHTTELHSMGINYSAEELMQIDELHLRNSEIHEAELLRKDPDNVDITLLAKCQDFTVVQQKPNTNSVLSGLQHFELLLTLLNAMDHLDEPEQDEVKKLVYMLGGEPVFTSICFALLHELQSRKDTAQEPLANLVTNLLNRVSAIKNVTADDVANASCLTGNSASLYTQRCPFNTIMYTVNTAVVDQLGQLTQTWWRVLASYSTNERGTMFVDLVPFFYSQRKLYCF